MDVFIIIFTALYEYYAALTCTKHILFRSLYVCFVVNKSILFVPAMGCYN